MATAEKTENYQEEGELELEEDFQVKALDGDFSKSEYTVARYAIGPGSRTLEEVEKMPNTQEKGRELGEEILEAKGKKAQEADLVELPPRRNETTDEAFLNYAAEKVEEYYPGRQDIIEGLKSLE